MNDVLKRILAHKAEEVDARRASKPMRDLKLRAHDADPPRGYVRALKQKLAHAKPAVIAEIKKASPSKGVLRADFRPAEIARSYERAGAAALSVLTDSHFFQGSDAYLQAARAACTLPVLRKDFVINAYQLYETRMLDADCALLIVAALPDTRLREFTELAHELGLDVLIEVHNDAEMARALDTISPLVGVNNRDLRSFEIDLQISIKLKQGFPNDRLLVTESGIRTLEDVALMRANGIHSFLVGEAFMRAEDPGCELQRLFG